ncbi:glyoxalase [Robiginitalea sp.]|nr:glyoxalase [Robiginitalea sp.]
MDSRSASLQEIRPNLNQILEHKGTTEGEWFQNSVLRPILKFQNDLLVAVFKQYIEKHKGAFFNLNTDGKLVYIENTIQKDVKFRNALKGMVIGQFTLEEYLRYSSNSSALNKRMMNMIVERLKDQIQLLDAPLHVL